MAKHDKLKLSIAKADRSMDFFILKYGSTERGKVVDVTVTDIDGVPYNLSGLDFYFVEELYNGQIVVDDGKQENAGSFVNTDLENGQFSYQFQEAVYQYDGWAHFKFMKGDNLIDTTAGFAIKILDDVDSDLDKKSYVAYFESIKKEHQDWLDKAKEMLASAQELNDGNHSLISECKSALDALTVKHNNLQTQTDTLSQTVTNNFTSLTGRIDTLNNEKDKLSGRVDTLNTEETELSNKVDDLKQNILDTINNKTKDMATTQDVAADAQRITALENAGFAKLKLDGFTSADDAQKWSADQHGISMFADEPETV